MKRTKLLLLLVAITATAVDIQAQKRIESIAVGFEKNEAFVEMVGMECSYNDAGKLQSVLERKNRSWTGAPAKYANGTESMDTSVYNLQWLPTMLYVQVKSSTLPSEENKTMSITLNASGNADVMVYDGDVTRFTYDSSDRMKDWKSVFKDGKEKNSEFSYFNDEITKMEIAEEQVTVKYSYSDTPSKIGLQLPFQHLLSNRIVYDEALAVSPDVNPILLLAEITGKPCPYLISSTKWTYPTQSGDRFVTQNGSYSYEFDKDGYVTKMTTGDFVYSPMVVKISYASTGGVGDVLTDDAVLVIDGRHVSAAEGTTMAAYDLQGRMAGSSANGSLELPDAGVYIVRIGAKAVKVAVR